MAPSKQLHIVGEAIPTFPIVGEAIPTFSIVGEAIPPAALLLHSRQSSPCRLCVKQERKGSLRNSPERKVQDI